MSINIWSINNLKAVRKMCGYTQKEVAELLGKEIENRLSKWESGKSVPSLLNTMRLCKLYDVSIDDLYPEVLERTKL